MNTDEQHQLAVLKKWAIEAHEAMQIEQRYAEFPNEDIKAALANFPVFVLTRLPQ